MAEVSVGDVPAGAKGLEHYAAALFQAAGYYVETNVEEVGDGEQVLELDLVATDYRGEKAASILGEAKSGKWGYSDVFKLAGWMEYLQIPTGVVICPGESVRRDPARIISRVDAMGISILDLGDFSDPITLFNDLGLRQIENDDEPVTLWRYSYWIETVLVEKLRATHKGLKERDGLRAAVEYRRLINDEIFFERDIARRLHNLYDAYKDHPKLTLGIAREHDGEDFDPNSSVRSESLNRALRGGDHTFLQASMYLEHRARLAVMKAAVDLVLEHDGDPWSALEGDPWGKLTLDLLPGSFRSAISSMLDEPGFRHYPKFWQSYLWSWGGFYLHDRQDEEFQWMAETTGLKSGQVPVALTAFDRLFPAFDSGWHWSQSNVKWEQIKLMPWPFRGLGAARRRERYGANSYLELGYSDMTDRDLIKWHNHFVRFLEGEDSHLE